MATPDPGHAKLIGQLLAGAKKSGYSFGYSAGPLNTREHVTTSL
jgi:hypothetical protein